MVGRVGTEKRRPAIDARLYYITSGRDNNKTSTLPVAGTITKPLPVTGTITSGRHNNKTTTLPVALTGTITKPLHYQWQAQ